MDDTTKHYLAEQLAQQSEKLLTAMATYADRTREQFDALNDRLTTTETKLDAHFLGHQQQFDHVIGRIQGLELRIAKLEGQ